METSKEQWNTIKIISLKAIICRCETAGYTAQYIRGSRCVHIRTHIRNSNFTSQIHKGKTEPSFMMNFIIHVIIQDLQ